MSFASIKIHFTAGCDMAKITFGRSRTTRDCQVYNKWMYNIPIYLFNNNNNMIHITCVLCTSIRIAEYRH
jgi:hypothetical protein